MSKIEKTGLVFGGGGAKGSYEIGVWMALRDLELETEITGVSGTSIGALNMALFAQNDLTLARTLWENLSTEDVIQLDMKKAAIGFVTALTAYLDPQKLPYILRYFRPEKAFGSGLLSQEAVKSIISRYVNPLKIFLSPYELYACCFRIRSISPEYFRLDKSTYPVNSVLLASAAIPSAFDAVKINGHRYYDGGLSDNVPIRPLYENGYRKMIAVNVSPWKSLKLTDFSDAQIWVITPQNQELFKSGLGHVFHFDSGQTSLRILSGYQDALKCLAYFPAENRQNLYEDCSRYSPADFGQTVSLENGIDITIKKAEIYQFRKHSYIVFRISTLMTDRADYGDSCFLLANILFLVFPDGRRSYPDLNLPLDSLYELPQYHVKGRELTGFTAFRLPEDCGSFRLIIADYFNHEPVGTSYYMNLKLT